MFGSPASLNACTVMRPAVWWLPWPSRSLPWKRDSSTQRPAGADDPHHVAHHVVRAPLLERLLEPLREAVVDHGGEVLLVHAVVAVRDPQFLGADQAEPVEQLRADGVVARLAAVERHQRQPRPVLARQPGDDAAVLVVRVRGGVHHAGRRARLQNLLPGTGRPAVLRNRLRRRRRHDQGQDARNHHDHSHQMTPALPHDSVGEEPAAVPGAAGRESTSGPRAGPIDDCI